MSEGLVLSVFPGIDLLSRAFEEEGYCIVRGPDPLWGGDVRTFHPPAGVFEGVIGGPPCQHWTRLQFLNPNAGKGMEWVVNEYARVVEEAAPAWFLMEEVPYAPMPLVLRPHRYHVHDVLLRDDAVGGVQPRERRFTFGTPDGRMLYVAYHERNGDGRGQSTLADGRSVPVKIGGSGKEKRSAAANSHGGGFLFQGNPNRGRDDSGGLGKREKRSTTMAGHSPVGRREVPRGEEGHYVQDIADACEAMGLPRDFTDHMPFTMHGKRSVLGNGVPMAMGRAVARAVREATRR